MTKFNKIVLFVDDRAFGVERFVGVYIELYFRVACVLLVKVILTKMIERLVQLAIVGAPNAGKSTLMNRFFPVSQRIAAVSPKYNTTRERHRAVFTEGDTQVIFVDTPGIIEQSDNKRYHRQLVKDASDSIDDTSTNGVLLLVDAAAQLTERRLRTIAKVRDMCAARELDMLLVLNKVDLVKQKKTLLPITDQLIDALTSDNYNGPLETHYVSAVTSPSHNSGLGGDDGGLQVLKESILRMAKPGEWHYDEDDLTDMTDEKIASELIRDQLFKTYQKEVPYRIVQQTVVWEERDRVGVQGDSVMMVEQALCVPSASMKRIVLGKNGSVLRKVRAASEKRISDFFESDVNLSLSVKVVKSVG